MCWAPLRGVVTLRGHTPWLFALEPRRNRDDSAGLRNPRLTPLLHPPYAHRWALRDAYPAPRNSIIPLLARSMRRPWPLQADMTEALITLLHGHGALRFLEETDPVVKTTLLPLDNDLPEHQAVGPGPELTLTRFEEIETWEAQPLLGVLLPTPESESESESEPEPEPTREEL